MFIFVFSGEHCLSSLKPLDSAREVESLWHLLILASTLMSRWEVESVFFLSFL